MVHKLRMLISAVLIALALLGTGWAVSNPLSVQVAGGMPGDNGG